MFAVMERVVVLESVVGVRSRVKLLRVMLGPV
jgi:hypothetical protein